MERATQREAVKVLFKGRIALVDPEVCNSQRQKKPGQLHFINMIIDHLTHNGSVAPERLNEPPFTDSDPGGVAGVPLRRKSPS